jgi:hypothetical protein
VAAGVRNVRAGTPAAANRSNRPAPFKNFIHVSRTSPILASPPLRETRCAPGIEEGRRCRAGGVTVRRSGEKPGARASLAAARGVPASPQEGKNTGGTRTPRHVIN